MRIFISVFLTAVSFSCFAGLTIQTTDYLGEKKQYDASIAKQFKLGGFKCDVKYSGGQTETAQVTCISYPSGVTFVGLCAPAKMPNSETINLFTTAGVQLFEDAKGKPRVYSVRFDCER